MAEADKRQLEEDTQSDRYLTFMLGMDVYGIEIKHVTEIIGVLPITKIPEIPEFVKGVINLRGQIIPVIDMRLKFHKDPVPYNDRTCIIVISILEVAIGLIVDHVAEVLTITEADIIPPPDFCTGEQNPYIKNIGSMNGQIKLLLDSDKLLIEEDLLLLENIKE